jgi:CYTH domain-containing protein
MVEVELEKTYLAKYLPKDLEKYPHREIADIYVPVTAPHAVLRIRKKGDKYEITKKFPIKEGDASEQEEHTIKITEDEYKAFAKLEGKRSRKIRYDYDYRGNKAEVDVFQDDLQGLVLVDIEFTDVKKKFDFNMIPEFCLADVTQDTVFAGGMLCGKKYSDVEGKLKGYGYKAIK